MQLNRNNYARTVGVFNEAGGQIRQMKRPSTAVDGPDVNDASGVVVQGNKITVRYSAYAPDDARCCPSLKKTARYKLANGAIIPAPYIAPRERDSKLPIVATRRPIMVRPVAINVMLPPPILASRFLLASLTLIATMILAPVVAFIRAMKSRNFNPDLRIGHVLIASYAQ